MTFSPFLDRQLLLQLSDRLTRLRKAQDLGTVELAKTVGISRTEPKTTVTDLLRFSHVDGRIGGHLFKLAHDIGPGCQQLCRDWFTKDGRPGQRRMWGLVGLARKHPAAVVEQACQEALHQGLMLFMDVCARSRNKSQALLGLMACSAGRSRGHDPQ